MELEVIRMVRSALEDDTIGVNAKLPGVPRDDGDEEPPPFTFADSTRDGWVARRVVARGTAAELPAIAVSILQPSSIIGQMKTVFIDGSYDVLIEHVAREAESDLALRNGLYGMRAVLRTLAEFNKPERVAMRQRNGIYLRVCTKMSQAPVFTALGELAVVTAALVASYDVRDTQPLS